MTRKKKFSFSTKIVPMEHEDRGNFQSQCRSGGGGNGRCGAKRGGRSVK